MAWKFETTIGPASFLAVAQLVALVIGGVYTYSKLESTVDNTKEALQTQRQIIIKQNDRAVSMNDRLIVVETTIKGMAENVTRLVARMESGNGSPAHQ